MLNMIAIQIETTVRTTAILVIIEYMKIRRSSPDEISAVVRTSASMGGSLKGLLAAFKIASLFPVPFEIIRRYCLIASATSHVWESSARDLLGRPTRCCSSRCPIVALLLLPSILRSFHDAH